jgi:hypothetical protein
VWHTAWTQRSETASRFAIRIMAYMRAHGFRTVSIDRKDVDTLPGITPNYVKRGLARIPKLHGTYDLPSIDNVLSYTFDPRRFNFR